MIALEGALNLCHKNTEIKSCNGQVVIVTKDQGTYKEITSANCPKSPSAAELYKTIKEKQAHNHILLLTSRNE